MKINFGDLLLVIFNWIELNWTRYAIAISLIVIAKKSSLIQSTLRTIDNTIWHIKRTNPSHSNITEQMSEESKQERIEELSRLQQQAKTKDRVDTVLVTIGAAIVVAALIAIFYNIFN